MWQQQDGEALLLDMSGPSEKIDRWLHHSNPMQLLKLSNFNKKTICFEQVQVSVLNDAKQMGLMEGS